MSYFEQDDQFNPPLNDAGVRHARAIRALLEAEQLDHVIATGLRRTVQTAELASGRSASDIEIIEQLQEAQIGTFEGIETAEEMEILIKGAFVGAEVPGARFLGGESYADVWERVRQAWEGILRRRDWTRLLIVAHGVVNRVLLAQSLGAGLEILRRFEQDPACVNVIDIDDHEDGRSEVAYVRLINFTPYNANKRGMSETTLESLWRQFTGD